METTVFKATKGMDSINNLCEEGLFFQNRTGTEIV